ncbi:MAG TPA: hypothetical protein VEJ86_01190, partial [Candidatus Binataceae bacterium]|nr:hypothetical protein [Candidatus Binataceae bacterium]
MRAEAVDESGRDEAAAVRLPEPRIYYPLRDESMPLCAAAVSLMLFAVAGFAPSMWPAAILAPLPLLAIAPELRDRVTAVLAFVAALFGNGAQWPAESFASPMFLVAAAHAAGAAMFASFVVLSAEATRRWNQWLAVLV